MEQNEEGIAWHNNSKPINQEKVQLDTEDVAGEDASDINGRISRKSMSGTKNRQNNNKQEWEYEVKLCYASIFSAQCHYIIWYDKNK